MNERAEETVSRLSAEWVGILFLIALFSGVALSVVYWSLRNGISPMPTSWKAKRCLLSALPEKLDGTIYELGSGWGTLLFPLAERYPGSRAVGIENSPLPFWASKMVQRFKRLSNVHLLQKDFYTVPLEGAGLVVCYLYPGAMKRLKEKFERELAKGTWVVSNTFAVPGWEPAAVVDVGDLYRSRIYVYQM